MGRQRLVDASPGVIPVMYQVPQICLITMAEVLVSVVSLDYFYSRAPPQARAFITALLLLSNSLGNLLCGAFYQAFSRQLSAAELQMACATLVAANAVAMGTLAAREKINRADVIARSATDMR